MCDSSKSFVFQTIYCFQLSSSSLTYVDLTAKPLCSAVKVGLFLPFICLGFPICLCESTWIPVPTPWLLCFFFFFSFFTSGSYCKVNCCEIIAQPFFCTIFLADFVRTEADLFFLLHLCQWKWCLSPCAESFYLFFWIRCLHDFVLVYSRKNKVNWLRCFGDSAGRSADGSQGSSPRGLCLWGRVNLSGTRQLHRSLPWRGVFVPPHPAPVLPSSHMLPVPQMGVMLLSHRLW